MLALWSCGRRRSVVCRSAPDGDPSELGSIMLILLWETGPGVGSRSAPIGTPSTHLLCKRFQSLPYIRGWGPDWVLKHTPTHRRYVGRTIILPSVRRSGLRGEAPDFPAGMPVVLTETKPRLSRGDTQGWRGL